MSNQSENRGVERDEGEYSEDGGSGSEVETNEPMTIGPNDTITLDGLLLCPFPGCLKDFSTRWSLNRHSRVHSGVKPYKCCYCTKDFAQNCSLKRHEQTHTQERQWVCSFPNCGKRFKLKEYLEVHHQRSHTREELLELQQQSAHEEKAEPALQSAMNDSTATIDQLRERLVRMSMRHHDQLCFHQEREQELIMGLHECSTALDCALQIIVSMSGGNMHAVPPEMRMVALKYSTRAWPQVAPISVLPPVPNHQQNFPQNVMQQGYPANKILPLPIHIPPSVNFSANSSFQNQNYSGDSEPSHKRTYMGNTVTPTYAEYSGHLSGGSK